MLRFNFNSRRFVWNHGFVISRFVDRVRIRASLFMQKFIKQIQPVIDGNEERFIKKVIKKSKVTRILFVIIIQHLEISFIHKNFPGFAASKWTHDTELLHHVNEPGGS